MFDALDHHYMSRALRLAERGLHGTDPNPRVGCVLVRNGEVIGEGWHRKAGEPHAEPIALEQAGEAARGATAYVTLEPCSHQGRTPSCADALIRAGVKRVIGAVNDPNPLVNGQGLERLAKAGIETGVGLMGAASEAMNAGFFKRMRENRPWVRVKIALSLDGKTALANGASKWITGEAARQDVQQWRARSSAVLTGIETVLADDPSLDVRIGSRPRQPLRVILDSRWRTPVTARTLGLDGKVIIVGNQEQDPPASLEACGAELLGLPVDPRGRVDLPALLAALGEREVNELQVEAGATLAGALLEQALVDELLIYQAPLLLGGGSRDAFEMGPIVDMSERIGLKRLDTVALGADIRMRFQPVRGAV